MSLHDASSHWLNLVGDKSNHIATVHTPQMLYVWPYIAFFSVPIIAPSILKLFLVSLRKRSLMKRNSSAWSRVLTVALFTILGLASVHWNTIIHPFTLSDNRHYVFYVFRILMRHWLVKYLAVPVYVICGWSVIASLGSTNSGITVKQNATHKQGTGSTESLIPGPNCNSIGFVLIWIATTALSVVTAPLVEPRYFIVPWVIWRMHVPLMGIFRVRIGQKAFVIDGQMILWLETAWFLLINAMTGYLFLYKTFEWPAEPGKLQRFMW
jgi:alpha-1,2-glucosyltransferase